MTNLDEVFHCWGILLVKTHFDFWQWDNFTSWLESKACKDEEVPWFTCACEIVLLVKIRGYMVIYGKLIRT